MIEEKKQNDSLSIWYFIGLGLLVGGSLFALYTLISRDNLKTKEEVLTDNEIKRLKKLINEADELLVKLKNKE